MSERALVNVAPRPLMFRPWWAVVVMFMFNGALFGVWASRIPEIAQRFSLDAGSLGLVLLGLAGGAIVSFPVAGAVSERWGAAPLTRIIAAGYAPALILIALAPNIPVLVLGVFLFGAAHGSMDVAMNGWAAEVERSLDTSVMSGFHAMFSLGACLGAASGYLAISIEATVLTHFTVLATVLVLIAQAIAWFSWPSQQDNNGGNIHGPLMALPRGSLLLVGLVAFGISLGEGAMADWSALFLVKVSAAGAGTAALGYAVFNVSMVTIRLLGDRIVSRYGAVATARSSALVAAVGVLCAVVGASTSWALLGFMLMGAGYAIVMPLAFSRAANDPHVASGPAIAGVATLGYGGMLLGPPLIGFLAELMELREAFALLGLLALMSAALAGALSIPRSE